MNINRLTDADYVAAEAEIANDRLDRVDAQFGCRKLHDNGLDKLIEDLKAEHDEPLARIGPSPEYEHAYYGDDEMDGDGSWSCILVVLVAASASVMGWIGYGIYALAK